jgi:hypothetical protein
VQYNTYFSVVYKFEYNASGYFQICVKIISSKLIFCTFIPRGPFYKGRLSCHFLGGFKTAITKLNSVPVGIQCDIQSVGNLFIVMSH